MVLLFAVGAVFIPLFLLFAVGVPFVLYSLVRSEHGSRQTMARDDGERTARRDSSDSHQSRNSRDSHDEYW